MLHWPLPALPSLSPCGTLRCPEAALGLSPHSRRHCLVTSRLCPKTCPLRSPPAPGGSGPPRPLTPPRRRGSRVRQHWPPPARSRPRSHPPSVRAVTALGHTPVFFPLDAITQGSLSHKGRTLTPPTRGCDSGRGSGQSRGAGRGGGPGLGGGPVACPPGPALELLCFPRRLGGCAPGLVACDLVGRGPEPSACRGSQLGQSLRSPGRHAVPGRGGVGGAL